MAMKNKKVLAVSISAVLAVGFLAPALMNAQAQVSSESRVLNTILALTQDSNKDAQRVNNNLDNIDDDLLLKQKFWQYEPYHEEANRIGIAVVGCDFEDESACAFNIESIQLNCEPGGCAGVAAVMVDGVFSDVSGFSEESGGTPVPTPTNLLVDLGVGKIGASDFVAILIEKDEAFFGKVEWNGEKPQGMELCTFSSGEDGGPNPCDEIVQTISLIPVPTTAENCGSWGCDPVPKPSPL
jgi:hypothetical protein